jgi:hypothetical protein
MNNIDFYIIFLMVLSVLSLGSLLISNNRHCQMFKIVFFGAFSILVYLFIFL